jgi:exosortase A-associated hydrolase 1
MSSAACKEEAGAERFVVLDCEGIDCLGVVALPALAPPGKVGLLVVVGGPQYRVGSHRQFVHLCRRVADAGYPSLRFDYRGMGDSDGAVRSFETIGADIRTAIASLRQEAGVDRVVLWGLCDGASAALMHAGDEPSVAGVVAVNPWARTPEVAARARLRHYYLDRLRSREFWHKALRGGLAVRESAGGFTQALRDLPAPPAQAGFLERMHKGWMRLACPALFILSGRDLTAREFETWVKADRHRRARLENREATTIVALEDADHTFASSVWQDEVARATIEWMAALERQP